MLVVFSFFVWFMPNVVPYRNVKPLQMLNAVLFFAFETACSFPGHKSSFARQGTEVDKVGFVLCARAMLAPGGGEQTP